MIHNYLKDDDSGDHWAVGLNAFGGVVLAQVQENGEQVRITLTPEQARAFAAGLITRADQVEVEHPVAVAAVEAHRIWKNGEVAEPG